MEKVNTCLFPRLHHSQGTNLEWGKSTSEIIPLAYTSVFSNVHGTRINQVYKSDWPGHFVRIKDREGHIMMPQLSFVAPYKGIFIPVLRHGSIACGVHKCELCRHHIERYCWRGERCTYAHSWDERLKWICPICTKDNSRLNVTTQPSNNIS